MKSTAANQPGRGQGTSGRMIISVRHDDIADEELGRPTDEELGLLVGVKWRRTEQDVREREA